MDLSLIERNWDRLVDTLIDLFPELDRKRIADFEGRLSAFVEHLAERHHLTREEAVATLEERVLLPAMDFGAQTQNRMAAE